MADGKEYEALIEVGPFSEADHDLLHGVTNYSVTAVQQALRNGANVNWFINDNYETPLMNACLHGFYEIFLILWEAGADARWRDRDGWSAITLACRRGHCSIVQLLLHHDDSILAIANNDGWTPLLIAFSEGFMHLVRILMDRGANVLATTACDMTTLMLACQLRQQPQEGLELVRGLLAAGVDANAHDKSQRTALHRACSDIEVVRELILRHNANMFAVDGDENTPFDDACISNRSIVSTFLIEIFGTKSAGDHGRLALHAILGVASYSFEEDYTFHSPLHPLKIHSRLGELKMNHFRILLHTLEGDVIRHRDDCGKLPIHIACRTKAPVEVLAVITELDHTAVYTADHDGALPLHECCCGVVDDSSVRYLVEQPGGVGTLAARTSSGALPLHILCGSTIPSLRTVQFLIQAFPRSVAARTNPTDEGEYPFMIAACETSSASLSVVYELVRALPNLVLPRYKSSTAGRWADHR